MSLWIWMLLAQMATAGATWAAAAWIGPLAAVIVGSLCGTALAVLMTRVVAQRLSGMVGNVYDTSVEAPKTGLPELDAAFAELRNKFQQCSDSPSGRHRSAHPRNRYIRPGPAFEATLGTTGAARTADCALGFHGPICARSADSLQASSHDN